KTTVEERLLQGARGRFDEFADDHRGSASYGRSAVGNHRGVRLHDFDAIHADAESFGSDLGEYRIGALAHLRAARENAYATFGSEIQGRLGREIFLARAREPCAMEESREADAAL